MDAWNQRQDERLQALESQARPSQEGGHLAGSFCEHGVRREDDPQWRIDMSQCAQCAVPDADIDASLVARYMARADVAEKRAEQAEREFAAEERNHHVTIGRVREITAERDAAIARADEAERERDEYREMCGRISAQCDELAESRVERNAEIERLREALRKIADGRWDFKASAIAQAALDGSGQHE